VEELPYANMEDNEEIVKCVTQMDIWQVYCDNVCGEH
jgi:hypothetical protein